MRWFVVIVGILTLLLPGAVAHAATTDQASDYFNVVEAYAVATNTWSSVASMPIGGRPGAVVAAPDGRIYVFNVEGTATTYAYTPATNRWSTLAPMTTPRIWFAAALGGDGRIYTVGGQTGTYTYVNTVEAYDPRTNSWQTVAGMPTARADLAAAAGPDGRIYAMSGYWQHGQFLDERVYATVEVYTPATNTWATAASMPAAAAGLVATTTPDGCIWTIESSGKTNVAVYTPGTNSWASAPSLLTPGVSAAATDPDGRIYALGGTYTTETLGGVHGDIEEFQTHRATDEAYTPGAGQWTAISSMPTPRNQMAAATGADGRIYAFGGFNTFLIPRPTPSTTPAPTGVVLGRIFGAVFLAGTKAPVPGAVIRIDNTPLTSGPLTAGSYQFPAMSTTDGANGGPTYTLSVMPPAGYVVAGPASQSVTVIAGHGVEADFFVRPVPCRFVLGFAALHAAMPTVVGACTDDEQHNQVNGDATQHTTNGLLVWRKADNVTAFTDGYRTWVNGPYGMQERLNTQRFVWEANPERLPLAT
ncbi:MAG: Kelch repeat-containing protein [Chloroflexota bacterium]